MKLSDGSAAAADAVSSAPFDPDLYPPICPHNIKRPTMTMTWTQLSMLHWRYDPNEVQRLLPRGLTVETFDGSAWVGLVPFQMTIDIAGRSNRRWLHFPETNVRTYVRGKAGKPGVWFFSLEASSLPAVVTARSTYRVPYFWADMSIEADTVSNRISYKTERKWPGPKPATSDVEIEVGPMIDSTEVSDLENFLTARWALYGAMGPILSYAEMYHEPWPLYGADVLRCDDGLVAASGLSQPQGPPIVHYSPGVSVRSGWPKFGQPS